MSPSKKSMRFNSTSVTQCSIVSVMILASEWAVLSESDVCYSLKTFMCYTETVFLQLLYFSHKAVVVFKVIYKEIKNINILFTLQNGSKRVHYFDTFSDNILVVQMTCLIQFSVELTNTLLLQRRYLLIDSSHTQSCSQSRLRAKWEGLLTSTWAKGNKSFTPFFCSPASLGGVFEQASVWIEKPKSRECPMLLRGSNDRLSPTKSTSSSQLRPKPIENVVAESQTSHLWPQHPRVKHGVTWQGTVM